MYILKKTFELDYKLYNFLAWFDAKGGQIFVSNEYLATKLHISTRTIQRSLQRLKTAGKIDIINRSSFKRQIIVIPDIKKEQKIDIPNYNWLEN